MATLPNSVLYAPHYFKGPHAVVYYFLDAHGTGLFVILVSMYILLLNTVGDRDFGGHEYCRPAQSHRPIPLP